MPRSRLLPWLFALAALASATLAGPATAATSATAAVAGPGSTLGSPAAASLGPQAVDSGFHAIAPARLLDTRRGGTTVDGWYAGFGGPLPEFARIQLPVLGRGGVPSTGVSTVVVNVTVDQPTAVGYVTVWPTGAPQPNASNVNFTPGRTVPNLVVAKVGDDGTISLKGSAGHLQLVVDVVAYSDDTGLTSLVPARVLDTRAGGATIDGAHARGGALGTEAERVLPVVGRGGLPTTDVAAVVMNLTVNEPTAPGYLTVWPNGAPRPNASNVNFSPGATVPNLVVAKVGPDGAVRIFNSLGDTHVIADVVGYFSSTASFTALSPARLLDTRPGTATIDGAAAGTGPLGTAPMALDVAGRAGVPAGVTTALLNVTVTNPTEAGFLTVWPDGRPRPNASSLNFAPGLTVANMVAARVGENGRVAFFTSTGTTDVLVDIVGWLPAPDSLDHDTYALAPGVVGTPYTASSAGHGGTAPYTWQATPLPAGLAIAPSTGTISGTPTTAGTVSTALGFSDALGRRTRRDIGHTVFPAGAGYTSVPATTVFGVVRPPPDADFSFPVTGVGGVPADAEAVALMVSLTTNGFGYTMLYPYGSAQPPTSSSSSTGGLDTNLVVVQPGISGRIGLSSGTSGTAEIVVRVVGYFPAGSTYGALAPGRLLDTRVSGAGPVAAGATVTFVAASRAGIPPGASAVLVNIVATDVTTPGALTAWSGPTPAGAPTMRWRSAGSTTQRFALIPLVDGTITVRADDATTHVIVDVHGYLE